MKKQKLSIRALIVPLLAVWSTISIADSDVLIAIIPTAKSIDLKSGPVALKMIGEKGAFENLIRDEVLTGLKKTGFNVSEKESDLVLEVTARRSIKASGETITPGFFAAHSHTQSDDVAEVAFTAKKGASAIWEATIYGNVENLIGEDNKYCFIEVFKHYSELTHTEMECDHEM